MLLFVCMNVLVIVCIVWLFGNSSILCVSVNGLCFVCWISFVISVFVNVWCVGIVWRFGFVLRLCGLVICEDCFGFWDCGGCVDVEL